MPHDHKSEPAHIEMANVEAKIKVKAAQ